MSRQNNSAAELTGEEWSLVVHCITKEIEAEEAQKRVETKDKEEKQ